MQVRGIRITAEGGESLLLPVGAVPQELAKALPNSVSAAAVWEPTKCGSATFLQPIKYPAVRRAQCEIQLELTDLPGQTTSLTPQLSFVPHATEKAALKVARAKLISQRQVHAAHAGHQGEDPGRRIVVACVAAKAALLCDNGES